MKQNCRPVIAVLILACLLLSACQQGSNAPVEEDTPPVKIEHLEGQNPTRETLTEDAVKRLDLQTAKVSDTEVDGKQQSVIPYSAILYDTQGATWVYTNPEPLIFVRTPITVDRIKGDLAFLKDGPPSGTTVVTVGAAELYGAEIEFEEE